MSNKPEMANLDWMGHMELTPLHTITNHDRSAGYEDEPAIQRFFSAEPLYSAVHLVRNASPAERHYSPIHVHDFTEVNILVGGERALVYRIHYDGHEYEVSSPTTIVIPPGISHAANLIEGSGAFVVLRLQSDQLPEAT